MENFWPAARSTSQLRELLAALDAHNCENNWHLLQDLAAGAF